MFIGYLVYIKRPSALLFNAGCNEQVFSPEPRKNLAQIRHVVYKKNAPLIPKNDVTEPKDRWLSYSICQLKSC